MKSVRIRVSTEELRRLLMLPGGSVITDVHRDAQDVQHGTITLRVVGAGHELKPGDAIPSMTLEEYRLIKPEHIDPLEYRKTRVPEDFNKVR